MTAPARSGRRVVIAPWMATAAIGALTFFGAGGIVIGSLMIAGAARVAAATGGDATSVTIGGAVIAAIGVVVTIYAGRQLAAVRVIEVGDAGWVAIDRLGRRRAVAPPLALELRCRRVAFTWGSAPRIMDVVDGWLVHAGGRRRVAPSGPVTWDLVLTALGFDGAAPRRGQRARYDRRAA